MISLVFTAMRTAAVSLLSLTANLFGIAYMASETLFDEPKPNDDNATILAKLKQAASTLKREFAKVAPLSADDFLRITGGDPAKGQAFSTYVNEVNLMVGPGGYCDKINSSTSLSDASAYVDMLKGKLADVESLVASNTVLKQMLADNGFTAPAGGGGGAPSDTIVAKPGTSGLTQHQTGSDFSGAFREVSELKKDFQVVCSLTGLSTRGVAALVLFSRSVPLTDRDLNGIANGTYRV